MHNNKVGTEGFRMDGRQTTIIFCVDCGQLVETISIVVIKDAEEKGTEKDDGNSIRKESVRMGESPDVRNATPEMEITGIPVKNRGSSRPLGNGSHPSEMPDDELEKLQAIYSEGYATAEEEKRLKEILKRREVRECQT